MTEYKRLQMKNKAPDLIRSKIKTIFCATCLSRDRKLFPIDGLNFDEFCADIPLSEDEDLLCWECKGIAVKINAFRHKACKAQALIENMIRRNKVDMTVNSLSNLKAVNRSENIIIGYEVDSDTNAQTTDVQDSIDYPKQEVDITEYDNTLSPDEDFTDPLDPSDGVDSEKTPEINKNKPTNYNNSKESNRNIVSNDLSHKRSVTKNRESQSDGDVSDSETDSPVCRKRKLRKKKHRYIDDDHIDVSDGPSSPIEPNMDQIKKISSTLQSLAKGDTNENDSTSMFQMLKQMDVRIQKLAHDSLIRPKKVRTNIKLISNVEEFNSFERNLENPEFEAEKRKQLSIFCTHGIGNGRNNAYTIVDKIFTREFFTKCSWAGGSRSEPKICFKAYVRFIEFFFNVLYGSDPTMTVENCEEFLKGLLKNSLARSQSLRIKKSTAKRRKSKKEMLYSQNLELLLEQADQAGQCEIGETGQEEQAGN